MHLYSQVENYILEQINNSILKEGDLIPTEMELSKQFNISRPTVRQALNSLVNKGYLNRVKGKGTFITKPKVLQEYTRVIESYNVEMHKKGLTPKTKVLQLEVINCNELISSKLCLAENEKVIKLKRLRYVITNNSEEKSPLLLTTVYIPFNKIPNLVHYDFEAFSLYEVLEKNNLFVKKVVRQLEAKAANATTAKLLDIKEDSPIQFISSIGYLDDGSTIEYSESIYPGEKNKFIVEIIR